MAGKSKFHSDVRYADTRGYGAITIEGRELETGDDGCVEAPAVLEAQMADHGFVRECTKAFADWQKARQPKPVQQPQQAQGARR